MANESSYFTFQRNFLFYGNKQICEFEYHINATLEHGEICFVLLEPEENENVYCVNYKGELKWKIFPDKGIHEIIKMNTTSLFEGKKYYESKCPYMEMELIGNDLRLYNWCGFSMIVNIKNGKIIKTDFVK
jgi:hypothetical protein